MNYCSGCHSAKYVRFRTIGKYLELSEEQLTGLWGTQEFYRVLSLVNGGRERETDLFAGLRESPE